MQTKTFLLVFLASLFSLVACSPAEVNESDSESTVSPTEIPTEQPIDTPTEQPTDTPAVPDELLGSWYWFAFQDTAGVNDIIVADPTKYTLDFLADGMAQIKADCNNASNSVTIDGSSLTLSPGPMTLVECEPGSLYAEFLAKLGDAVTYAFDEDGNLVLALIADAGNMIFDREATPTVPSELVGQVWYWLAFQDSTDGAESNDIAVSDPSNYTLEFLADGMAQITADCNSAVSNIIIESGGRLTFAPGPMTLAECEPGSLYHEYLAKLGDVVTYVFDEDGNLVLNLKMDAGNVVFGREATPTVPSELVGQVWYWLAFQDSADGAESNDITVSDPSNYTLELLVDGTAWIKADCNSAVSNIIIEGGGRLTFAPGPMTLAECEPGSLYHEYLAKLGDVVTYVFDEDGNLVLNLKMDAGNMVFGREALSTGHVPAMNAQDIHLDIQSLLPSWYAVVVPEKSYDQSMPPGPVGLPAHIEILFGVTDLAERHFGDPIMYLIPVEDYRQMWQEAGNTAVANILAQIADRTYNTSAPGSVAMLPFEEIIGPNDLAVQIGRAVPFGQLNETSAAQSGYRFVGRWAQDANPVTNQGLTYVYQGFTNDGRYLVSFFHPITTEALPFIEEVSQAEFDRLASEYDAYMAEKTELLNGLDSADFTPNLAVLDALIASLAIDSVPVSGLLDKTWQWVGGPVQPGSSDIISIEDPELYQVTYRSDGTIEIVADCNQANLSYELNQGGLVGGMLAMPGPMTLAECGPESHYQGFIYSLEAAQGYRVHPGGNEMSLILPAGGGILSFVAAP